jgi:hypothetical protein
VIVDPGPWAIHLSVHMPGRSTHLVDRMAINTHHRNEHAPSLDLVDINILPRYLTREEWYDSWTEELVTTYHILTDHCRQYGLPFFEKLSFSEFIDVAYDTSDKITTG